MFSDSGEVLAILELEKDHDNQTQLSADELRIAASEPALPERPSDQTETRPPQTLEINEDDRAKPARDLEVHPPNISESAPIDKPHFGITETYIYQLQTPEKYDDHNVSQSREPEVVTPKTQGLRFEDTENNSQFAKPTQEQQHVILPGILKHGSRKIKKTSIRPTNEEDEIHGYETPDE